MEITLDGYAFYIRPGVTDMRKGSAGLALIVQGQMELDPYGKAVFLFCGRSRKTVKAIVSGTIEWE